MATLGTSRRKAGKHAPKTSGQAVAPSIDDAILAALRPVLKSWGISETAEVRIDRTGKIWIADNVADSAEAPEAEPPVPPSRVESLPTQWNFRDVGFYEAEVRYEAARRVIINIRQRLIGTEQGTPPLAAQELAEYLMEGFRQGGSIGFADGAEAQLKLICAKMPPKETFPKEFEDAVQYLVANTHYFPVEPPAQNVDNRPAPDTTGREAVGLLNKSLAAVLREWGVPETDLEATAAELERVARVRADAARRPKWADDNKRPELARLTAPEFLKVVWKDKIIDGVVKTDDIGDKVLLKAVSQYRSNREDQNQPDYGDAEGLTIIKSQRGRPKTKTLSMS